jgi:hypothetical protein
MPGTAGCRVGWRVGARSSPNASRPGVAARVADAADSTPGLAHLVGRQRHAFVPSTSVVTPASPTTPRRVWRTGTHPPIAP